MGNKLFTQKLLSIGTKHANEGKLNKKLNLEIVY